MWFLPKRPVPPAAPVHIRTGAKGETIAAAYLYANGYLVLHRNIRLGKDEIDIIAFDTADSVLVFAEVKTRSSAGVYHPEINITRRKRRCLLRSARLWVHLFTYRAGWRIDVICVAKGAVVDHFKEIRCE